MENGPPDGAGGSFGGAQTGSGGSPAVKDGAAGEQTPSSSTGKGGTALPLTGNWVPVVSTVEQAVIPIVPRRAAGTPVPVGLTSPAPNVQLTAPWNERTSMWPPARTLVLRVEVKPPTARSFAPSRVTSPRACRSMTPPLSPWMSRPVSKAFPVALRVPSREMAVIVPPAFRRGWLPGAELTAKRPVVDEPRT